MCFKITAVLFALALLTGCKRDFPVFDAVAVELHADGQVKKGELSPAQIKTFSGWLRAHPDGWKFQIVDDPQQLVVYLKREGRIVTGLNIGDRYMRAKNHVRTLTADERALLALMLTDFTSTKKGQEL